ncbi:MAG: FtsX-like permease family protein [Maribacter sp.]
MQQPPKLPLKVLRFFCAEHRLEEIEGDLFEEFQDQIQSYGYKKARRIYYWTVLRSFRSYLFDYQSNSTHPLSFISMIRHYFKTALRGIFRHKSFSIINIVGLCIGLSSSLILGLFIADEFRKDYDLEDKDIIYRVEGSTEFRANEGFNGRVHSGLGSALVELIPQVTHQVKMNKIAQDVIIDDSQKRNFYQEEFISTDSTFFDFFPQNFIEGVQKGALNQATDIIITEKTALKLFGTTSAIGKDIVTTGNYNNQFTVTAVVKDPPPHSSIQFSFLNYKDGNRDNIRNPLSTLSTTYIKLAPNEKAESAARIINTTIIPLVEGDYMKTITFRLSSFQQAKYDRKVTDNIIKPSDKQMYIIFAIVAIFILALAIINYTNLSAARALQRGQEAGLRKIIGAGKLSFIYQFVAESFLFCFSSLLLSLLVTALCLPYFEQTIGHQLIFNYWSDPWFWVSILATTLLIAIVAGLYPAFLVSRFKFTEFIKGNIASSTKGASLRKGLVVFQFVIPIVMIVCAKVVRDQVKYMTKQTLAFEPDQIILVDVAQSSNFNLFKTELKAIPEVTNTSFTTSPPGGKEHRVSSSNNPFGEVIYQHNIDHNYAEILDFEFITGGNFNPDKPFENDDGVIINETLAKMIEAVNPLGVDNPLEKPYSFTLEEMKIKGIIKDIHMESLYESIKPMIFVYEPSKGSSFAYTLIEVSTDHIQETIAEVEKSWTKHIPDRPFQYQFLDTRFDNLYSLEIRLGKIFGIFTTIAILISCLGLYGLVTFMVQSKTKEVGVRKVLGASVLQIIHLFNKQIYRLIVLAGLVAVPLAYLVMNSWLNDFAYHVEVSFLATMFIVIGTFILASLTVFARCIKAATSNPVDALRSE